MRERPEKSLRPSNTENRPLLAAREGAVLELGYQEVRTVFNARADEDVDPPTFPFYGQRSATDAARTASALIPSTSAAWATVVLRSYGVRSSPTRGIPRLVHRGLRRGGRCRLRARA